MTPQILDTAADVARVTTDEIITAIHGFTPTATKRFFALELPTGSMPLPVYQQLV